MTVESKSVGAEEKGKSDSEMLWGGPVLRDLEKNCKDIYKVMLLLPIRNTSMFFQGWQ